MKTTMIALALLLGLAACAAPNAMYCPQGYDTVDRCHKSGDHADRPDRDRGEQDRSEPSGESEDRGEQDRSEPSGESEDRGEQDSPE